MSGTATQAGNEASPQASGRRILVLDHRDSFVFTLVDQFARLGHAVQTVRTSIALDALQERIATWRPDLVLLSPGPGTPEAAGVMLPFLRTRPALPVVGICLGHQAMAVAAGGRVTTVPPVHGAASPVVHDGDPVFAGITHRFAVARYHSLGVTTVPSEFRVIAHLDGDPGAVMAMRHKELPYVGIQFHPESVLTPFGSRLIANLLAALAPADPASTST